MKKTYYRCLVCGDVAKGIVFHGSNFSDYVKIYIPRLNLFVYIQYCLCDRYKHSHTEQDSAIKRLLFPTFGDVDFLYEIITYAATQPGLVKELRG